MPGSRVPVIRQPFAPGDLLPYWALGVGHQHELFDVAEDPAELHDRAGEPVEKEMADKLRAALLEVEAPAEQLERLGIA
jgi:hypothetical protein